MELAEPYIPPDESLSQIEDQDTPELLPEPTVPLEKKESSIENQPSDGEVAVKEGDLIKQAMEKLPEAVLPHVLSAAEQNMPLEAVYERRHEVKDESSIGPVPISSVISDRPKTAPLPSVQPLSTTNDFVPIDTTPNLLPTDLSPTITTTLGYTRAVRLGFIGGLIVVGLLIIYQLFQ